MVLPTKERAVFEDTGTTPRFCKIHHVLDDGKVFVDATPASGSPSGAFSNSPYLAEGTVKSVYMGQVQFDKRGKTSTYQATLFDAAPGYAMTAGQSVDEYDEEGEWLGDLVSIRGSRGAFVPNVVVRKGNTYTLLESKNNMAYVGGLPGKGADVAVLKGDAGNIGMFLLPCSPTLNMEICVFSYPGVTAFMQDAYEQLVEGKLPLPGCVDVWLLYSKTIAAHGFSSRAELYKLLEDAFNGFSTGQKVASPGKVVLIGTSFIGGCYTTVGGSSGAPICAINSPGFYCGIHIAGSGEEHDMNIGTSCDNPDFVKTFKETLLDKLPGPEDPVWDTFPTLDPFENWLERHGLEWERPRGKKRFRRDEQASPASPSNTFRVGLVTGQEVVDAQFTPVS